MSVSTEPWKNEEQSPFIQACSKGDLATVVALANENPLLIEIPASNGLFPLMVAAFRGHTNIVSFLLEKGADPNASPESGNYQGKTALFAAPFGKQCDIVRELLNKGADPNIISLYDKHPGTSPLLIASCYNQSDMVWELLNKGADPNNCPTAGVNQGKTALEYAIDHAAYNSIKALFYFGASLDNERIKNFVLLTKKLDPLLTRSRPLETRYVFSNQFGNQFCLNSNDVKFFSFQLLQAANALFELAEKPIDAPQAFFKRIDDLVGILGIGLNARKNGKTAAQTAVEKGNVLLAQQLAIYGADLTGIPECDNAIVNIFAALQQLEKLALKIEKEEDGLPQPKIKSSPETKEEQDKESQESASQKESRSHQEKISCLRARLKEVEDLRSKIWRLTHTLEIGLHPIQDSVMARLKKTEGAVNILKRNLLHCRIDPAFKTDLVHDSLEGEDVTDTNTKITWAIAAAEPQLLFRLLTEYVCNEYMSLSSTLYENRDQVLSAVVLKAKEIIKNTNAEVTTLRADNMRLREENARLKSQAISSPPYLPSSTAQSFPADGTEASQTSESTNPRKRKLSS